jgi:hypothetical protein
MQPGYQLGRRASGPEPAGFDFFKRFSIFEKPATLKSKKKSWLKHYGKICIGKGSQGDQFSLLD